MTVNDETLTLDPTSFNSAERLECQTRFDAPFGELLRCVFDALDPRREGPPTQIIDRDGVQHFPDQIMQFMLCVQARRTNPLASLGDFDELRYADLASAYVRGRLGKETKTTEPTSSSQESSSADSSPD